MSNDAFLFFTDDLGYSVTITPQVTELIRSNCVKAGGNETGGILIGKYIENGHIAVVTEATGSPEDSISGRTSWQRGKKGLKALLADRWKEGLWYLGEWHFHPGSSPAPSGADLKAMTDISTTGEYQCKAPLLLIAGGTPPDRLSISITVFPAGKSSVSLFTR
ncbi:TPA: Mov34/MPN/PAD-1 family protein [Escherichia coli]|nr:Mov34/MPN/PAD-1 family protein [Escherichia coli]